MTNSRGGVGGFRVNWVPSRESTNSKDKERNTTKWCAHSGREFYSKDDNMGWFGHEPGGFHG